MASKARKKYKSVTLTKAAEEEAYFQSGQWLAERAARTGKTFAEFAATVERETEKFGQFYPHPFPQVQEGKMDRYRQHLWKTFSTHAQPGA